MEISSAENRLGVALEKGRKNRVHECIQDLEELVTEYPDLLNAWGNLGYQYFEAGDFKKARVCYEKVCGLAPDLVEGYLRLGDTYFGMGERRRAYKIYLSVEDNMPGESELQDRLIVSRPVWAKLARDGKSVWKSFQERMFERLFRRALFHEFLLIPRSISGIRAAGTALWFHYIDCHFLRTRDYELRTHPCDLCGSTATRAIFFFDHQKKVRCKNCGLEFVERRPSESQDVVCDWYNKDATIEYFDTMWTDEVHWENRFTKMEEIFSGIGVPFPLPTGNAFEVGCGKGHVLEFLAKQGLRVAGIETGQKLVDYCRVKRGLDVEKYTVQQFDGPSEQFDYFLAYHVLEHLDHPSILFEKARRMLKPGGYILLEVPTPVLENEHIWKKLDKDHGYANSGHLYYFNRDTLSKYFPKFGFELLNTYEYPAVRNMPSSGFLGRKI